MTISKTLRYNCRKLSRMAHYQGLSTNVESQEVYTDSIMSLNLYKSVNIWYKQLKKAWKTSNQQNTDSSCYYYYLSYLTNRHLIRSSY